MLPIPLSLTAYIVILHCITFMGIKSILWFPQLALFLVTQSKMSTINLSKWQPLSGIWIPKSESGIRETFASGLRNLRCWDPGNSSENHFTLKHLESQIFFKYQNP